MANRFAKNVIQKHQTIKEKNKMNKIQIKSIYGNLLFEGDFSSLADCLVTAVKSRAYLAGSDLAGAYLAGSNLADADLADADLAGAYLAGVNLAGANLAGANLARAKNATLAIAKTRILPEGDLIGWKKCAYGLIVKLLIPAKAKRSHAFGRKCRAEYVKVLAVYDAGKEVAKGVWAVSKHDGQTKYLKGKTIKCDKWETDWQKECAGGIHFFITKEEAEAYDL